METAKCANTSVVDMIRIKWIPFSPFTLLLQEYLLTKHERCQCHGPVTRIMFVRRVDGRGRAHNTFPLILCLWRHLVVSRLTCASFLDCACVDPFLISALGIIVTPVFWRNMEVFSKIDHVKTTSVDSGWVKQII